MKKNNNRLAIIRSAETKKITINPNQTVDITGQVDKVLNYPQTSAIIQESTESQIPSFIGINPTVIQYNYTKNEGAKVTLHEN